MNRAGFLKRMAFAAIACALIDVPKWVRPREVEPGNPWSLSEVLAHAQPGDVIIVPPQEHWSEGPFVIPKGVTMKAHGSHFVARTNNGPIMDINGDRCEVVNCWLEAIQDDYGQQAPWLDVPDYAHGAEMPHGAELVRVEHGWRWYDA